MRVRFRAGIGPLPSEEYANWVSGTPCPECGRPARMKLALYLPKAPDGSPVAYAFEHEQSHCQQYAAEEGLRRLREAGLVEVTVDAGSTGTFAGDAQEVSMQLRGTSALFVGEERYGEVEYDLEEDARTGALSGELTSLDKESWLALGQRGLAGPSGPFLAIELEGGRLWSFFVKVWHLGDDRAEVLAAPRS